MSSGHQHITWRRNIAENFNRLSRVHERYRQTDDRQTSTDRRQTDRRQTDARRHIANVNMSSRSLIILYCIVYHIEIEKVISKQLTTARRGPCD